MGTWDMTGYLAQQCIKHLPTDTATHAAVNRILVRLIYIYIVDVVVVVVKVVVFVIIVLARSSGHRTGMEQYDTKTYNQKDTYVSGPNRTPHTRIPYIL